MMRYLQQINSTEFRSDLLLFTFLSIAFQQS